MEHREPIKSGIHYHICWSDSSLDCATKQEAMQLAATIKRPRETYIVVERDDQCERCKDFSSKALFVNDVMKERSAS